MIQFAACSGYVFRHANEHERKWEGACRFSPRRHALDRVLVIIDRLSWIDSCPFNRSASQPTCYTRKPNGLGCCFRRVAESILKIACDREIGRIDCLGVDEAEPAWTGI